MIVFVWTEIKICVYYRLRLQSSSCGRSLKRLFVLLELRSRLSFICLVEEYVTFVILFLSHFWAILHVLSNFITCFGTLFLEQTVVHSPSRGCLDT